MARNPLCTGKKILYRCIKIFFEMVIIYNEVGPAKAQVNVLVNEMHQMMDEIKSRRTAPASFIWYTNVCRTKEISSQPVADNFQGNKHCFKKFSCFDNRLTFKTMSAIISLKKIAPLDIALGIGFALALNAVMFGNGYFSNPWVFLVATICTATIGVALSYIHYLLALRLDKRIARKYGAGRQLLVHLLFFPLTALVTTGIFFGYQWLHFPGYTIRMENYKWVLLIGFVADLLGMGFGMAIHSQAILKQTELEKEKLQKMHLEAQLEILKKPGKPSLPLQ